jgi:hypothetical protein
LKFSNPIGIKQAKEISLKSSKVHSHQTKKKEFINREGMVAMKELTTRGFLRRNLLKRRLSIKDIITERVAKKEFITERVAKKEIKLQKRSLQEGIY